MAIAGVLAPAVRMHNQSGRDPAVPVRRLQGLAHDSGLDPGTHRPPDDPAAGEIHDAGEGEPALTRRDAGEVGSHAWFTPHPSKRRSSALGAIGL